MLYHLVTTLTIAQTSSDGRPRIFQARHKYIIHNTYYYIALLLAAVTRVAGRSRCSVPRWRYAPSRQIAFLCQLYNIMKKKKRKNAYEK